MSAVISECGTWRYRLSRWWGDDFPATFVMLNPSTADAENDDPTIRRCAGFARSWGCGGIVVVNLYAYRATDPKALWLVDEAQRVGPENVAWLAAAASIARRYESPMVAAWGANARPDRVAAVRDLPGMDRLQCLGVTKDGHPRHPLYVRGDTPLSPWPPS